MSHKAFFWLLLSARMDRMSWIGVGLLAASALGLGLVQFLPWQHVEFSQRGFTFGAFEMPARQLDMWGQTWGIEADAGGVDDFDSWFGTRGDGTGTLATASIVLVLALAGLIGAALLGAFLPGRNAALVASGAAALMMAGFILAVVGHVRYFDDLPSNWHAGFYVAIVALACALAGTALAWRQLAAAPRAKGRGAPKGAKPARVSFD